MPTLQSCSIPVYDDLGLDPYLLYGPFHGTLPPLHLVQTSMISCLMLSQLSMPDQQIHDLSSNSAVWLNTLEGLTKCSPMLL